jgi:predicted NACHT family NTPase
MRIAWPLKPEMEKDSSMVDVFGPELIKAAIGVGKHIATKSVDQMIANKEKIIQKTGLTDQIENTLSALSPARVIATVDVDADHTLSEIQRHIETLAKWSSTINFKDLSKSKRLDDIYIHLDTFLVPRARHVSDTEQTNRIELEHEITHSDANILIHGLPGAGKTTSMKRIVKLCLENQSPELKKYFFPVLIRLRELDASAENEYNLVAKLSNLFAYRIEIELPKVDKGLKPFEKMAREAEANAFIDYLNHLRPLLILDGFDEIADPRVREAVLSEISSISRRAPNLRIVLTCRTGEIGALIDGFEEYEIAPLSWDQIENFAAKWIPSPEECTNFVKLIKNSPFADTAFKPLSLAHLCAIYERTGRIPDKPKAVYRRVVRLLIEDWDEQRRVKRESKYARFDLDQKYEFLANLAYYFSVDRQKYVMSHADLQKAYLRLSKRFGLNSHEQDSVVAELESHTGLFVQSGSEKFEFAHKSLQEYLAVSVVRVFGTNSGLN